MTGKKTDENMYIPKFPVLYDHLLNVYKEAMRPGFGAASYVCVSKMKETINTLLVLKKDGVLSKRFLHDFHDDIREIIICVLLPISGRKEITAEQKNLWADVDMLRKEFGEE